MANDFILFGNNTDSEFIKIYAKIMVKQLFYLLLLYYSLSQEIILTCIMRSHCAGNFCFHFNYKYSAAIDPPIKAIKNEVQFSANLTYD